MKFETFWLLLKVSIVLILGSIGYVAYTFDSADRTYITTGVITEMEFEDAEWDTKEVTKTVTHADGTKEKVKEEKKVYDDEEYDLEITYTDSEGETYIYKEEPTEKSDWYLYLEKNNLGVGDTIQVEIIEHYIFNKFSDDYFISSCSAVDIDKLSKKELSK